MERPLFHIGKFLFITIVAGTIPQILVQEKVDSLSTEIVALKNTIQELDQSINSIDQNSTTRPVNETWDAMLELSRNFPKAIIKVATSPDQSSNRAPAWWGEISGKANEVLSLMYLFDKHEHVQLYSFSYADKLEASALFYVIEGV